MGAFNRFFDDASEAKATIERVNENAQRLIEDNEIISVMSIRQFMYNELGLEPPCSRWKTEPVIVNGVEYDPRELVFVNGKLCRKVVSVSYERV